MPDDFRTLIEKILSLPADRLAQLEDFVDFLAAKSRRAPARDTSPTMAPPVRDTSTDPLVEEDIRAEQQAVREALRLWTELGSNSENR